MQEALKSYNLILMDQRGTGKSSPLSCAGLEQWLAKHGTDFVADFMTCFRADSIVRDAEVVRKQLLGDQPWSVLGQSFGGFCAVHYLSHVSGALTAALPDTPCPLKQVFITGGLPCITPAPHNARDVYRTCMRRVTTASKRFFELYPVNKERVRALARALDTSADGGEGTADTPLSKDSRFLALCDGSRFTMRRLATCGLVLGLSTGPAALDALLEAAFTCREAAPSDTPGAPHTVEASVQHAFDVLGDSRGCRGEGAAALEVVDLKHNAAFASRFRDSNGMVANVMYWLMHESIYAQGSATAWAAQAVVEEHEAEHGVTARSFQFYGEMVFPWMAEDYPEFAPLAELAGALARRCDWPALYDAQALQGSKVPLVATVYTKDAFVPVETSTETAAHIGQCTVVENSSDQHDGLHVNSAAVWGGMLDATRAESSTSGGAAK